MDFKKFDFQDIVNNVKSMISPSGATPQPADPEDTLGLKMAEMSILLQEMGQVQAEQAKKYAKVNGLLNEVLELVRSQTGVAPKTAEEVAEAQTKTNKPEQPNQAQANDKVQKPADAEATATDSQEKKSDDES